MLLINTLGNHHKPITYFFVIVMSLFIQKLSIAQDFALVNNGCNIYISGTGNPNSDPSISLIGSFLNLNDGFMDGRIELDKGHIWLNQNWLNQANNNVFTNFTGNFDGFVTFENPNTLQIIDGLNPTYFENIILKNFKKQLNNSNLVQNELSLNAILYLNENTFEINNPNPLSLNHISGYIVSESLPGNYGFLQWNISNGLGTYKVPFGSDFHQFDDLNFSIDIKTPMGINDNIKFATYPTDIYNNPLPIGSSILELEPHKVVDRFWIIEPSDNLNNPTADMVFTYTSRDVVSGYNSINTNYLKASRNNTIIGQWLDMQPRGINALNTVKITDVLPNDFFPQWTLVNMPGPIANVFVPDAFTPDGNGLNDIFIPVFQENFVVNDYEFLIFDRWGIVQFQTKDPFLGWNGKKNNIEGQPVLGVYTWVIIVKGYNSDNNQGFELREKINGRVTLYN